LSLEITLQKPALPLVHIRQNEGEFRRPARNIQQKSPSSTHDDDVLQTRLPLAHSKPATIKLANSNPKAAHGAKFAAQFVPPAKISAG